MLPTAALAEQIAADAPLGELIGGMKQGKQRFLIDDAIAKIQAGIIIYFSCALTFVLVRERIENQYGSIFI